MDLDNELHRKLLALAAGSIFPSSFHFHFIFSPNRPTGPLWSSSRNVRPLLFVVCRCPLQCNFLALTESAFSHGPSPASRGALKTGRCSKSDAGLKKEEEKNGASGNKNIGATIRIGREIWCLPYAGFLSCRTDFLGTPS